MNSSRVTSLRSSLVKHGGSSSLVGDRPLHRREAALHISPAFRTKANSLKNLETGSRTIVMYRNSRLTFRPSRLFMYFGTHSWCSVQSACRPQGQPKCWREKSQIFFEPGRKQWQTFLSLVFCLVPRLRMSCDLFLEQTHGLFMSKLFTS